MLWTGVSAPRKMGPCHFGKSEMKVNLGAKTRNGLKIPPEQLVYEEEPNFLLADKANEVHRM